MEPRTDQQRLSNAAMHSRWRLRVKNGYGGRSTGTSVVLQTADDFGAPRKSAGRCGNIAATFRRRAKMV